MIILDANLLLYAYLPSFREHLATRSWLEDTLNAGQESVGLSWPGLTAYLRISTHPRLFYTPLTTAEAVTHLTRLLEHPLTQLVQPQARHWQIFTQLLITEQFTADLVMDAHLAALTMEHKARLATTDRDFTRFRGLKFFNPLVGRI